MRKALAISIFVLASLISLGVPSNAYASTIGFKAGDIMDDTVMTDASSMSASQVQTFLNSKIASCDTYGQKISEYGGPDLNGDGKVQRWEWGKAKYNQTKFVCLKDYKDLSGRSAAQIILDKSKKYSINPQTLIVLLQKEQGLVTDTWPLNIQYRTATGYGCPDTAPCDSQYFGLSNQLDWAAKMFHSIITEDPNWYSPYFRGTNPKVYWHPSAGNYVNSSGLNDSRAGCGYNGLTIENWTTASLYSYTPYRPNKAALDAGWGTGDACSSYGNRNFYSYFTDWFGSTSTPLFTIQGSDATVYFNQGTSYYPIPSQAVLRAWGLSGKRIISVSPTQLSTYTQGPMLGTIVKFGSEATVYLVDRGKLTAIPSWSMLGEYGYSSGDMITYSDTTLKNRFTSNGTLSQLARRTNGAIYFVDAASRHAFPDGTTYSAKAAALTGVANPTHATFSDDFIGSVSEAYPILLDGVTISPNDSAAIYLHDNGKLLLFDPTSWRAWGHKLDYGNFSSSLLSTIPRASVAPMFITESSNYYIVAGGEKLPVSSTTMNALGLTTADFTALTTRSTGRLPTGSSVGSLIRTPNGAVYSFLNQKRYVIPSSSDFTNLGYKWNSVTNLDYTTIDTIAATTGTLFAPGSLIRTPDGAVSLIDTNFRRYVIPSLTAFNDFGFSWSKVRNYPASTLAIYANSTLQPLVQTSSSGPYKLADKNKILTISSGAYSASQFNLSPRTWTTVSSELFTLLKTEGSLTYYIQGDSAAVYKVVNGTKRAFRSATSFYQDGGAWNKVTRVSNSFLGSIPTGSPL